MQSFQESSNLQTDTPLAAHRPDQQRVLVLGDPHTGKSVFSYTLVQELLSLDKLHYPHRISATKDGEGQGVWFHRTSQHDSNLAMALKEHGQGSYSEAFIGRITAEIEGNIRDPIMILDVGGVIDDINRSFAALANRAVILYRGEEDLKRWRDLCDESGVKVIAEIESDYNATDDTVLSPFDDGILKGIVHHLDRGEECSGRAVIQELARRLTSCIDTRYDAQPLKALAPTIPTSTYLVSIAPPDPTLLPQAPLPVVTLKVKFNQEFKNVPGDRILLDALTELEAIQDQIPEDAIVLIDGPMSMPVAGALTRRLQTGTRVVALFSRDVADFVVVSSNDSSFPPGVLMQRQVVRHGEESCFSGITLDQVLDPSSRTSLKVSVQMGEEMQTPELIAKGVQHLLDEIQSSGVRTGGTLYLSGRMPVALEAALQDVVKDQFERIAVFVPAHPGDDRYLCVSSSSGEWLPEPSPLHLLKELDAIPVASSGDKSDALLTIVGDPEFQAGTNQLVREAVQRVGENDLFNEGGETLYINGKIPVVVAASLASKATNFNSISIFIPQHHEENKYLISDSYSRSLVGTFLPHPRALGLSLPVDEMIIKVLGEERLEGLDEYGLEFLCRAVVNAQTVSRTISGIADRSASEDKPELLLAGHSLAKKATENLIRATYKGFEAKEHVFRSPQELATFLDDLYVESQRSLLSDPRPQLRSWSLPYSSVPPEEVKVALSLFFQELFEGTGSTEDPVKTIAEFQRKYSHDIHPMRDGTGRMTLLIGNFIAARHGILPPVIPSRESYYNAMDSSNEALYSLLRGQD